MKIANHTRIAFLLLVGAWMCGSCSLSGEKFHRVTIVLNGDCNAEQQAAAREVVNRRMASLWSIKEATALADGCFSVGYSGNDTLLTQILATRGEVYVSEMYRFDELRAFMLPVYTEIVSFAEKTGAPIRLPTSSFEIPLLWCAPQQIAYADSVLESKKHLFPPDLYFCWSAYPDRMIPYNAGKDLYALLALRKSSRELPFNPHTVQSTGEVDNRYGYRAVSIALKEPYAGQWASLTRDNISRALAIVMDGKALSWPIVQSEITGGKLSITGSDDLYEDFPLIRSAISGGVLDCPARLANPPAEK